MELKSEPFVRPLRACFEDNGAGSMVYHARYLNSPQ